MALPLVGPKAQVKPKRWTAPLMYLFVPISLLLIISKLSYQDMIKIQETNCLMNIRQYINLENASIPT